MKIELELCSMRAQEIIETSEAFIELHDNFIHWKVRFSADEPVDNEDTSLGVEAVNSHFEAKAFKTSISAIELEFIQVTKRNKNKENRWCVSICVNGMANDIKMYFPKAQKAKEIYQTLSEWLFTHLQ